MFNQWRKNFLRYGVYTPHWVTNGDHDPSTEKKFHRGPPASTWWFSTKQLKSWGLNGYYRV